tara:strand:- start:165 stop:2483 length:2319 start_codon:yes stop_codon:yes gene_type:complete
MRVASEKEAALRAELTAAREEARTAKARAARLTEENNALAAQTSARESITVKKLLRDRLTELVAGKTGPSTTTASSNAPPSPFVDMVADAQAAGHAASSATKLELAAFQREIAGSDRIIDGLNAENSKAREEVASLRQQSDRVRQSAFDEREVLNKRINELTNRLRSAHSHGGSGISSVTLPGAPTPYPADLPMVGASEAEINDRLQRVMQMQAGSERELKTLRDQAERRDANMRRMAQQLEESGVELRRVRKEKKQLEYRFAGVSPAAIAAESDELQRIRAAMSTKEATHARELSEVQSKLEWHVENVAIVDGQQGKVAELEEVVKQMKEQLKEHKPTAKVRSAWRQREKELQEQIHALEEAMRRRNPDSVASLLRAAGPSPMEAKAKAQREAELDGVKAQLERERTEWAIQLRRLRQEFEQVSLAQEKQIREMRAELEAERKSAPASAAPPAAALGGDAATVEEMRKELERTQQFFRTKLTDERRAAAKRLQVAHRGSLPNDELDELENLRVEVASLRHANSQLARSKSSGSGSGSRKTVSIAEEEEEAQAAVVSIASPQPRSAMKKSTARTTATKSAARTPRSPAPAAPRGIEIDQASGIAASMKRHELRDRLAVAASELEHERDHEQAGSTQRRPHTSTPTQRRPPHPHTPPSRPYSGAKGDGSAAAAAPASFKKMTRSSSSPAQSKSILIATSRNQPVVADESQLSSLRGAHTLEMQRMRDAHEARLVEATQRVSEAEAHYVELSQLYASAETKYVLRLRSSATHLG